MSFGRLLAKKGIVPDGASRLCRTRRSRRAVGRPEPGSGESACGRLDERPARGNLGRDGGGDDAAADQGTRRHPYVSDGWEPYVTTIKAIYREREPSGIRPGWD